MTCGVGKRNRHRSYVNNTSAELMACSRTLHEEDICYAAEKIFR